MEKIKIYRNSLLLCLMTSLFLSAKAQHLSVEVSKDTVLIGDIFTMEWKVLNTDKAFFPYFKDTIGKFEIIEDFPLDTLENGFAKRWDLSIYEAGAYEMTGFSALAQQNQQQSIDTLVNDDIFILYVSTLPVDTTKAFKPIKAPKSIPYPYKEVAKKYLPYLLALLLLAVLIFLFFKYKKRKENQPEIVKTPLDFHQEALAKLQDIEQQKLWQEGKIKEYYLEISEILRTYLEGRFNVNAMESTTDEIIEDLLQEESIAHLRPKLKSILQQCDLAKFAKFKPEADENISVMKASRDFVAHTKPKQEEEQNKDTE